MASNNIVKRNRINNSKKIEIISIIKAIGDEKRRELGMMKEIWNQLLR